MADVRAACLAACLLLSSTLATASATSARDTRCDDPARGDIACPDDAEVARYIVSVTATHDGVSILLTGEGIALGRSCQGAARLVRMASGLYASLPADQRLRDDLLWANPTITREVFAHAWGATLGIENGNPVDIVFADYTGDSSTLQGMVWGSPINAAILCSGE